MFVTSIDRFAVVGQPSVHRSQPAQCTCARRLSTISQPSAFAPVASNRSSRPMDDGSCVATAIRRSTRRKYGSNSAGESPVNRSSRAHRSRTSSGVRQAMAPLITVDPPAHRPSEITIGGDATATCSPVSR
jgi:hypothetical protein